jgi:hypothetical protein
VILRDGVLLVRIPPTRPSLCSAMVAQLTFNQWVVGSNPTGGIMDIDIRDECVALSFARIWFRIRHGSGGPYGFYGLR